MEDKKLNIYEKLSNIQNELKAPKGQRNTFGNYNYRSAEDILEAVKPILKTNRLSLVVSDDLENIGDRYYIKAMATLYDLDSDNKIYNTAFAREEETKKGMDGSQITGTASSYARKYALNGLFNIDDTKDADTDEYQKQTNKVEAPKKVSLATTDQKERIKKGFTTDEIKAYLEEVKKAKLSDLTIQEASSLLSKITK